MSKGAVVYRTIFFHCILFTFLAWLCLPNLNHDMLENYAWGQTFEWGSFKHPPLFSWVTHWWFNLWPTTTSAYYTLSYVNDALALVGIIYLTKHLLNKQGQITYEQKQSFLFLVLFFSMLAYPYNLYAVKFNADTILFSLWPWTAFAFLAAVDATEPLKKWLWTFLLSALAAACMLSKYFSAVLLLTLFIISLIEPGYRRWYKTPYPYVSVLFFLVVLTPHMAWEIHMDFPFRHYTSRYFMNFPDHASAWWTDFFSIVNFSTSGVYYFILSWGAWVLLRQKKPKSVTAAYITQSNNRVLAYLCFFPMVITLLSALLFKVHLMERWATSMWFALPILMTNLLSKSVDLLDIPLSFLVRRLRYFWMSIATVLLTFTFLVALFQAQKENRLDYAEANKEMAETIAQHFTKKFPGKAFTWISGFSWPDHPAALAFYLPNHPRALPFFPDQMPALVNPHATWNQEYGAIICGKNIKDNPNLVADCIRQTHQWLTARNLPIDEETLTFHAQGWRYAKTVDKQVVVFWVSGRQG